MSAPSPPAATPAPAPGKVEDALGDAAAVTERAQRAVRLFTEIAEGTRDPHAISDEVDALLDLLGRLDREGRHKEALRLARDLAALLALLLRWLDLIRSLQLALKVAQDLGDKPAEAWALHELGSLELAAGDAVRAVEHLEQAVRLKEATGSHGRCASRHNLDAARRDLAERAALERLRRRRLFRLGAAGAILLFLGSGGVALGLRVGSHHHNAISPPSLTTTTSTGRTSTRTHATTPATTPTTTPTNAVTTTPTVLVDTTGPAPTLASPADGGFVDSATPTFRGAAGNDTGDSSIVTVFISDSNLAPAGGSPLDAMRAGSSFSTTVPDSAPLPDGPYSAHVVQNDDSNNTGTSPTITFTVDTVLPIVTLTCGSLPNSVCSGSASELDQRVMITITDEGPVKGPSTAVSPYTIAATVGSDHGFKATLDGTSGGERYQVVATQTDAAGNIGASKAVQLITSPF